MFKSNKNQFLYMIPTIDEDRLKSSVYRQLEGILGKVDYPEYVRLCRSKYEDERRAESKHRFNPRTTYDEEMLILAYSYHNSSPDNRKKIDAKQLG